MTAYNTSLITLVLCLLMTLVFLETYPTDFKFDPVILNLAKKLGIKVKIVDEKNHEYYLTREEVYARYHFDIVLRKRIMTKEFIEITRKAFIRSKAYAQFALLHELAHCTMAPQRMNRRFFYDLCEDRNVLLSENSVQENSEETLANYTAYLLTKELKLSKLTEEEAYYQYLGYRIRIDDEEINKSVIKEAEKIKDYMLGLL